MGWGCHSNNQILKSILGDDAVDIQHIGSTAIPAIKAKPIIDIAVGVTDFEKIMSYNEQLQKEGIFYRGSDVENQILYVMGVVLCQDLVQVKMRNFSPF